MLLAIDTSTHIPSIALYDERGIVGETTWRTHENHTRSLMPQIVRLLELVGTNAGALKAVAVATGPGSFTGLRIGVSAAKGLAHSLNIPIVGIPTLDISAAMAVGVTLPVCAVMQAGRTRFGAAIFDRQGSIPQRRGDYIFGTADELAVQVYGLLGAERACFIIGELDASVRAAFRREFAGTALEAGDALDVRRAGFLAALAWQRWQAGAVDDLQTLAPYYIPTLSVA